MIVVDNNGITRCLSCGAYNGSDCSAYCASRTGQRFYRNVLKAHEYEDMRRLARVNPDHRS